ncbi:hypothetical protein ABEB36_011259 [Hypothenemus hampei]|uniref:LRRCT domain-containing protein n=1 Tax=Hypothenemus hampei TaxID=57062 RepID=A0ABD1EFE5_HYPHA
MCLKFQVISLDLSFNYLETFPSAMEVFSELKHLNLSHNKISTLKFTDLNGLVNLQTLDLTYNAFHDWKDIHSGAFSPTINLLYLDFSHNPLRSISKYSNHLYVQSLEVLRLVNCSMDFAPLTNINRLLNLKELDLSKNPITSINDTFQLQNIRSIDLSMTNLKSLHEDVFVNLPSLEILRMNNNINLRKFICHSDSLLYLDLSNSEMLDRIPTGRMRKLYHLDMSGNFLKIINGNSFANMINLQLLNLSMNAITVIHEDAFRGLNQLTSLDLSYNKIKSINEKTFVNNSALTYLNLSHNYINELDTISSSSLKVLIASYCEIYQMNRYSLTMMPNLVTLEMSRNFLTKLPDGLIALSLVILDLSYCRISSLTNDTFKEMFYLRDINLAYNALTTIDPSYFPRAFKATISNNPWRCDCKRLKRMFEWMVTYSSETLDTLICDSPEKVEGKTWEEACQQEWSEKSSTRDVMWYYSLAVVIAMVLALFALVILRKVKNLQEQRIRLAEEARRTEEREALRRMQERQREFQLEEDRNAPDPRELQRPPSYNEALLLPRLDASQPSLAESLGSRGSLRGSNPDVAKKNKIRRKRRRRKSEEERRASRITVDSDSSDENQSADSLQSRRKLYQAPPLESDF